MAKNKKSVKLKPKKQTTTKKATKKKIAKKPSTKKVLKKTKIKTGLPKLRPSMSQPPQGKTPVLGAPAPNFALLDSQGNVHNLSEYRGKKVVLYFYPKDDTPGCTLEGQQFTSLMEEFKAANTVIFGISRDSVKSHDKFKCKYNFGFELLSDEKEEVCRMYDVIKEKNMYGKKVMGIERSTFIIDEGGNLAREFRKVQADGHAAAMLEEVKGM